MNSRNLRGWMWADALDLLDREERANGCLVLVFSKRA